MDSRVNNDGLLGVIAALTAGGKSGRLQITGPGTRGAFFFRDGKLIDAHMGPFSGFPALNLAVSIREATFTFDSSIQSSRTAAPIPLNERLLLKERFGIETSELLAVEDQTNLPKGADLPIFVTTDFSLPENTQGMEVSDAKQSPAKNSPVFNPKGRTAHVRESRRRAARNRVAGRQKNKAPAIANQFWKQKAKQVHRDVANDQNSAIRILEEDNRIEKSAPAKALERALLELDANPRTESAGEPANSGRVPWPAISQESLAADIRDGATTKRCPICNRVYDDSRNYCRYDSAELVTQSDTSLNVGAEPQVAARTVLLWMLIILTFLASGVCSYWLNSYFSKEPGAGTQIQVGSKEPANTDEVHPVVEGALRDKQAELVMPEYPASAKNKGVTGKVTVSVLVNKRGVVVSARALNGDKLLRAAAVTAARKSTFSTEKLVGEQSRISGTITYDFKPAPQ